MVNWDLSISEIGKLRGDGRACAKKTKEKKKERKNERRKKSDREQK